jgi:hypothetical protein
MALKFHTAFVGDFLKGLMKTQKSKDAKVQAGGSTYWLTDMTHLAAAIDDPDCTLQITGLIEGDDGEMYMTILADMLGSGDQKKLALRYSTEEAED